MKDNRKKQMRPTQDMSPIPARHSSGRLINVFQDECGKWCKGDEVRAVEPTDEYRFLLSEETRARLEAK